MQDKHLTDRVLTGGMIISMALWGLSWPSSKFLTHYCTPANFAIYRYIIVIVTLLPGMLLMKVSMRIKLAGIPSVLASGVLLALYSFFFFKGLQKGAAGAGGVLVTTMNPIMAYMISILLSRQLPSKNETIGLALGILAGSFLLKVWDKPGAVFESGNLYFLLAAFLWSAMSKFTSRGHLYGTSLGFSLWQYVVTLLCLLPILNVGEIRSVMHVKDSLFWGNLFFSSAIVTSLATTMFFYTTTRLGAEKASSFIFLVPFAAALSAWIFLGEHILPHTIIGGALGMTAVYMINRKHPEVISEPD